MLNKEIDLKKFLIFLIIFVLVFGIFLGIYISKKKPLCKDIENPCVKAKCNECKKENEKKVCSDCNIYNEDQEHIWTGSCIYE